MVQKAKKTDSKADGEKPKFSGVFIPAGILARKNISVLGKVMLSDIAGFKNGCWQDNEYLARKYGVCRKSVFNTTEHLKALGLMKYTPVNKRRRILKVSGEIAIIFENADSKEIAPVPNESGNKYPETSQEFQLAKLLLDEIQKRKPDFREPNLQSWAKHIDLLLHRDKRSPGRIGQVIRWCQADNGNGDNWKGWQNNILSTKKLREKFDRLELSFDKENGSETRKNPESDAVYIR